MIPAGFQDIIEADYIALDIGIRVLYGIPDSCLGSQVYHYIRLMVCKEAQNQLLIPNIPFYKTEVFKSFKALQPGIFKVNIIIIINIINTDYPAAFLQQSFSQK